MGSWQHTVVQVVFWAASVLTVLLILRRPYLAVRLGGRRLRMRSYFMGALLGPVLLLGTGLLSTGDAARGIAGNGGLQPGGVLALFLAMVFMSIFLDITGFFEMAARYALRNSGTDGRRLFHAIYATVSVLTVFTSNDIVILTFTPFVYHFARGAGLDPTPYLVAEFFAANTWSMLLIVGNPTNILLAGASGMDFVPYLRWMALPTIAAGLTSLAALRFVFRREIRRDFPPSRDAAHPSEALTDRKGAAAAGILMAACIVLLAAAPWLGIPMWTIAVCCSLALLLVLAARDSYAALQKGRMGPIRLGATRRTFVRMPWSVVPFILSLFVTVEALHRYGHTSALGRLLLGWTRGVPGGVVTVYGIASTLAANLLNNIPMSLGFTFVMQDLAGPDRTGAVLATVIGSNLGANLTPLGALAGIMWMGILHGKEFRISFARFVRYGLLVTPLALAAALAVLAAEMALSN